MGRYPHFIAGLTDRTASRVLDELCDKNSTCANKARKIRRRLKDNDNFVSSSSDRTEHIVLFLLCEENPNYTYKAEDIAMGPDEDDKSVSSNSSEDCSEDAGEGPLDCAACNGSYYKDENNDTACQFHDGLLEGGPESAWEDEEEEYPELYKWTCCGKQGSDNRLLGTLAKQREGCVKGRHMTEGEYRNYQKAQYERNSNKRPATDEGYDGSVKRLAVAASTDGSEVPPKDGVDTAIPVPVPVPVAPLTAISNAEQQTVIVLSDGEEDKEEEKKDEEKEEEEKKEEEKKEEEKKEEEKKEEEKEEEKKDDGDDK